MSDWVCTYCLKSWPTFPQNPQPCELAPRGIHIMFGSIGTLCDSLQAKRHLEPAPQDRNPTSK